MRLHKKYQCQNQILENLNFLTLKNCHLKSKWHKKNREYFFLRGNIFPPDWPESSVKSWQH